MSLLRVFHCCSRSRKPRRLPAVAERLRLRARRSRPSGGVRSRLVSPPRRNRPKRFEQSNPTKHETMTVAWYYVQLLVKVIIILLLSLSDTPGMHTWVPMTASCKPGPESAPCRLEATHRRQELVQVLRLRRCNSDFLWVPIHDWSQTDKYLVKPQFTESSPSPSLTYPEIEEEEEEEEEKGQLSAKLYFLAQTERFKCLSFFMKKVKLRLYLSYQIKRKNEMIISQRRH